MGEEVHGKETEGRIAGRGIWDYGLGVRKMKLRFILKLENRDKAHRVNQNSCYG